MHHESNLFLVRLQLLYTQYPWLSMTLRQAKMPNDALFPDQFVLWDVITHNEIAEFESALNGARDERDMQRFLEAHPLFLIQQISGGSGAWLIPQKRLGSELITDFLIAQKS
jgi:hypothetical protein